MIRKEFSADRIPFFLSDHDRLSINLEAGGIIDVRTDDDSMAERIKTAAVESINEHIAEYYDKASLDELPDVGIRLEGEISEELKSKFGTDCAVVFEHFAPDERSQKMIDDMERMKKFSDPAFAAAELERAMKQAQETALKNGMSPEELQRMMQQPVQTPDLPPIPDGLDPLARAQAIAERQKQLEQMAKTGTFAAAQAAPQAQRPKFCGSCGSKLPESGNFCPNCGNKI